VDGSGVASCTTSYSKRTSTKAPPHQITATYSGDDANTGSSDALTETVVTLVVKYATSVGIAASASSVVAGHPVAVTATVTTVSGVPTGSVRFLAGSKEIKGCKGVKPNASGVATCTAVLDASGSPSLTARFLGDKFDSPSTSPGLPLTVTAAPTSTTVTSSPGSVSVGQVVTFTATVTSTDGGEPRGPVAFSLGGEPIPGCAAKALSGAGTATCKTKPTTAGPDQSVEADYSGSGAFVASSGTGEVTVTS
jgi:hypothetical protein